ncbi:hypothetical protein QBZ16_005227 [Prototheca wickerhamii]|uniref:Uncharacterized protein n=1 Tax=Prototheca wickerhamii TaxID=3111 RepID=A0AAD9IES0_PROWI|nr:hypothetical protein QBZ16_005227 [Prototheca wickerhamii]
MEEQAEKFRTQKSNNNLLLVASARGFLADVRDEGPPDGRTPLHLAALRGHAAVAEALSRAGAWLGAFDAADCTPLHLAARQGHGEAVDALLRLGADAGVRNRYALRPVDEAAVCGHLDAATALQRAGGGAPDARAAPSLLVLAAGLGRLAAVRALLADGADVNAAAGGGTTALHAAALAATPAWRRCCSRAGPTSAAPDAQGRTPLDLARRAAAEAAEARRRARDEPPPLRKPWPPAAPRPRRRRRSATSTATVSSSFAELEPRERLRKVERWAAMRRAGQKDELEAATRALPAPAQKEVAARLAAIADVDAQLNIHRAVCAYHEDADFQSDGARLEVKQAIEDIQRDSAAYERLAADPMIAGVLTKLRRMHAVCTANGQRRVDLDALLVAPGDGDEARRRDRLVLDRMEAARPGARRRRAAAAAACAPGDGEDAVAATASAMYEAVVQGAEEARLQREAEPAQVANASPPVVEELVDDAAESIPAARPVSAAKKSVRFAETDDRDPLEARVQAASSSAAEVQGADRPEPTPEELEQLPEWMRGPFSWSKVWAEFWRQCKQALVTLVIALVVLTLLRWEFPWVSHGSRGAVAGDAGSGASSEL